MPIYYQDLWDVFANVGKEILFTTHLITNFSLCAKHRKGTVLRSGAEQIPPEQPQLQQQPLYHQPPVQPPPPQGENLCQF